MGGVDGELLDRKSDSGSGSEAQHCYSHTFIVYCIDDYHILIV